LLEKQLDVVIGLKMVFDAGATSRGPDAPQQPRLGSASEALAYPNPPAGGTVVEGLERV
jgi:hypothetical protein